MSDNTEGTQPATPNNRTGYLFLEAVIRQFLAYQFQQISKTVDDPNVTFIEELFHKAGEDVVKQLKTWWRTNVEIPVVINYPITALGLPFVAVVNGTEREKSEESYLGDYGGRAHYGKHSVQLEGQNVLMDGVIVPDDRPRALYTRELLSVPMAHSTKIYIAGVDPNTATYLYHVVMALLLVNKVQFMKYGGMRDLSFSGGDLEYHQELFPESAYFKVITLTYDSNFDVPLAREGTIGGVDVTLHTLLSGVLTQNVNLGE